MSARNRAAVCIAARLVSAALVLPLGGCVSQVPMQLNQAFSDPGPRTTTRARAVQSCPVIIDTVADTRVDPAILGTVAGRAVRAPEDTNAWLRNVLSGLDARGVTPGFDTNPGGAAEPIVANVALRTAWVSEIHTSKTATTLFHVRLRRGEAVLSERDYRGTDTVMNWSSGDGELQRMVDRAFGVALDQIARDVRAACGVEKR